MPIERLRASRSFVTEFIEIMPRAVYAKDCAGRILLGNQAFAEAVGWPNGDFIGKTDLELLANKELALTVMANDRSVMERRGRAQLEEMLRAADGTESYWLSTKAPFSDEEGDVVGLVGVSVEITERKRLAERDRLLAREIEHRNKNLLGIAQSIVRMTLAPGVEAYREAVLGRFAALGRVQGLLGDGRQEIGLETLLADELDAYNIDTSERIQLSGPPINVWGPMPPSRWPWPCTSWRPMRLNMRLRPGYGPARHRLGAGRTRRATQDRMARERGWCDRGPGPGGLWHHPHPLDCRGPAGRNFGTGLGARWSQMRDGVAGRCLGAQLNPVGVTVPRERAVK